MVRNKHLVLDEQVKLYVPLWWHGQKSKLPDSSPTHCDLTPSGAYFKKHGYWFDGTDDYMIDADNRKILQNGTAGEWSSILLTDGEVPSKGSIQGTGTKLYLNAAGAAPKITGKIILYPEYCPSLITLDCNSNSITVLDVSALTLLTALNCHHNSITVLDVSALTLLTILYCYNNSITTLNVSALTLLTTLHCVNNSITVLDVSALTLLTALYCNNNSITTLNVSALTLLTTLNCHYNSITVLDVSALTLLTILHCHHNSMNQAMVDTVLCDMDGHGTNNGTLNISNNAAPSATGTTCAGNLTGRGWTVTTD